MMKMMKILGVNISYGKITYNVDMSDDLKKYFVQPFDYYVDYFNENMEETPTGIAVIPLVTNILPLIWLTDATLIISEIDKKFFESIDDFKSAYINLYPQFSFKGKIICEKIIDYSYTPENHYSTFFSGGVDSYATLSEHYSECKPDLVTIWGSDISLDSESGWENVKLSVCDVAEQLHLKNVLIKSTFRRSLNYKNIDPLLENKVKNSSYWFFLQHGIALIGHMAPYTYKYKIKTHFIPASYCSKDNRPLAASVPEIDEKVSLSSCNIIHDLYDLDRQERVMKIIDFSKQYNHKVNLRVCWHIDTGENCCHCEKCYRTMLALLVEGENPNDYGFRMNTDDLENMKIQLGFNYDKLIVPGKTTSFYEQIIERAIINKENLKNKDYYKNIKWIYNFEKIKYDKRVLILKLKTKIAFYFNRFSSLKRILIKLIDVLFSVKNTIGDNILYFIDCIYKHLVKPPIVKSKNETVDYIVENKCSVSRYGDGEIKLVNGEDLFFQKATPLAVSKLREVLSSDEKGHIVCLIDALRSDSKDSRIKKFQNNWDKKHFPRYRRVWYKYTKKDKTYYNATITRPYIGSPNRSESGAWFENLKRIWDGYDVVFIEGKQSRLGVGNDLFDNAKSIRRILGPQCEAFDKYDEIIKEACKIEKSALFLIALGPCATALAYDLHKLGYRAIDIGHVDIEYEWFLIGAEDRKPIKGKMVYESLTGKEIDDIHDEKYESEIITEIG